MAAELFLFLLLPITHPLGRTFFLSPVFPCVKNSIWRLNFSQCSRSQFLAFLCQFFDLVDCVVATDTSPQSQIRLPVFIYVRVSSLPSPKTFLKTTEHSWVKTILSWGVRRKLFKSSLINKLIRIEWVIAIRLNTKLMDVTSSMSKNRLACKNAVALAYFGSCRFLVMGSCLGSIKLNVICVC